MADLTELLVAAMERHLLNRQAARHEMDYHRQDSAEAYRGEFETIFFDLDTDVEVAPIFSYQYFDLSPLTINSNGEYITGNNATDSATTGSPAIRKGRYLVSRSVEQEVVWNDTVHGDRPIQGTFVDRDGNRTPIMYYENIDLVFSESSEVYRCLTLIELLALLAAQDARKAGRTEDEEALLSLVPFGTALDKNVMTLEQRNAVYEHIADVPPVLARVGGRQFTAAMGANTKTKGRVYESGEGITYTRAGKDNDIYIQGGKPGELVMASPSTNKTLFQIAAKIFEGNIEAEGDSAIIHTSVKEMLEPRGQTDTRKRRESLMDQMQAVLSQSWRWYDSEDGTTYISMVGSGRAVFKRGGAITLSISRDFLTKVLNAGMAPTDPVLLKTDDRSFPHSFAIGYRLSNHTFMNYGKGNEYRISVKSLLDYVKSLPTYEEVEASDRGHQTDRIIKPLETSLRYLEELGFLDYWDYCHENGESLTDEEQALRFDDDGEEKPLPYDVAKRCLIEWTPRHKYTGALQAAADARLKRHTKSLAAAAEDAKEEKASKRRIRRRKEKIIAEKLAERELSDAN